MKEIKIIPEFIDALEFAATRHRFDKTKNDEPYINHIISVCGLLVKVGDIIDKDVLIAAALHDVLEKTNTKPNDINFQFGQDVYNIVLEVTDHHSGDDAEKFRMQLERVDSLSEKARVIKLADKIANVKLLLSYAPEGWDIERRSAYINWADRYISAIRGTNKGLEDFYDEITTEGRKNNLYIASELIQN